MIIVGVVIVGVPAMSLDLVIVMNTSILRCLFMMIEWFDDAAVLGA